MRQHAQRLSAAESKAPAPVGRPRQAGCPCLGNQALLRRLSAAPRLVQPKLEIGAADDPLEREADAVAERVMRAPDPDAMPPATSGSPPPAPPPATDEPCLECEDATSAQGMVLASADAGFRSGDVPASVEAVLGTAGEPLAPSLRAFFEPRFGLDFAGVRVHTGRDAAASAAAIGARAYAAGEHIAFASGAYAPESPSGRGLIAHELTHVAQQRGGEPRVSRDIFDDAQKKLEEALLDRLRDLGNKPLGPPSGYTNPACPPQFCQPFVDKTAAIADLAWAGPLILAGIAKKISPRVVPFWAQHLAGGAAPQNISPGFGKDFTASSTTADTTTFLMGELRSDVQANGAALLGGAPAATIDFTPRLSSALAAIDDQSSANVMDFNVVGDIPGNLAGGIGKDETTFKIGAKPSPFNDQREATISATLTKQAGGDILVTPTINYLVHDTVDLCPGNCGAAVEQAATIPLSRFEATGLSGDVPFTVSFPAPAAQSAPFTVTPAAPAPVPPAPPAPAPAFPKTGPAHTTGTLLRVRAGPGLKFPVVKLLAAKGTAVNVTSQAHADAIAGNDVWDQISGGWVSDAYIAFDAAP